MRRVPYRMNTAQAQVRWGDLSKVPLHSSCQAVVMEHHYQSSTRMLSAALSISPAVQDHSEVCATSVDPISSCLYPPPRIFYPSCLSNPSTRRHQDSLLTETFVTLNSCTSTSSSYPHPSHHPDPSAPPPLPPPKSDY
jgi:hypothetical protein